MSVIPLQELRQPIEIDYGHGYETDTGQFMRIVDGSYEPVSTRQARKSVTIATLAQQPEDHSHLEDPALDEAFQRFANARQIVMDGEGGWTVKEPHPTLAEEKAAKAEEPSWPALFFKLPLKLTVEKLKNTRDNLVGILAGFELDARIRKTDREQRRISTAVGELTLQREVQTQKRITPASTRAYHVPLISI